ncbi:MAG: hypothetical protein ACYCXY_04690 [Acidimicrobiales bacterium]
MMWWRHGLTAVALRFPFLGRAESGLAEGAERVAADPGVAASEMWSYLDTRDAATACLLALEKVPEGCHVVGLSAPETLAPYPTEALLDSFHPDVPRRAPLPGRTTPIGSSRASAMLGRCTAHVLGIEERPFVPKATGP